MVDPPFPDPAQGVFTTMLAIDGEPIALDAHLARLSASVGSLYGGTLPVAARERARAEAGQLAAGRLRLTFVPGETGGRLDVAAVAIDPAIVLPGWEGGLDLRAAELTGWDGVHKWADRGLLEELESAVAPAAPLLVGPGGAVLETTRASVFAVVDGRLVTPPASAGVLPGVVRAAVLELAAGAGIDTAEAPLTLAHLAGADEAFATGAVRLLEPIRSLDGAPLAGPGRVGELLAARLRDLWLRPGR